MLRETSLIIAALLAACHCVAQADDMAYMPKEVPARTADDAVITMHETDTPGVVAFSLPPETYRVDLLNGQGRVVDSMPPDAAAAFDLDRLRPGTWTLRAHTPVGMRVRRFVVSNRNGLNRAVEASARPKGR
ncbi:MAG: hypothetical protein QY325_04510 [Flavobacteriales bacterium]|jgi:hypothetical protein|nr:MAG: hypothetical protein QY325_04510 [Flavobacteriales bacterium]